MEETIHFKSENRAGRFTTKLHLIMHALLSVPKTIYVNIRCFPLRTAVKLPLLISYRTVLVELHRDMIEFSNSPSRFMVKIGFGGSTGIMDRKSLLCLESGRIVFEGKASFGAGIVLRNGGQLTFGDGFWANKNCTIWCSQEISFGKNVLFGWNIVLRDSDGHLLLENDQPRPVEGPIQIGNHCWICSESHILKNSGIGNDCVLGYGSLLTKQYEGNNILYAGRPAKPIKRGINWIRGE